MFGDRNLLSIAAPSKTKYITSLMEILFTTEERLTSIIIEPGKRSRSTRKALDNERVEHLKSNFLIKFFM